MFSHPELGSDPPIGSGRELGRDRFGVDTYFCFILKGKTK